MELKSIRKILKEKKIIERKLNIKIKLDKNKLLLEGNEEDIFLTNPIFEAIDLGFPIETALLLADTSYIFEKIYIKNLTKRTNLFLVRARIIGRKGQTKELIEELSQCYLCLHDNIVGIIGQSDKIRTAMQAVSRLIQGSKQASVYAYLEKQNKIFHPEDLGLKDKF
jgi:ribosomal RNA assembly protein